MFRLWTEIRTKKIHLLLELLASMTFAKKEKLLPHQKKIWIILGHLSPPPPPPHHQKHHPSTSEMDSKPPEPGKGRTEKKKSSNLSSQLLPRPWSLNASHPQHSSVPPASPNPGHRSHITFLASNLLVQNLRWNGYRCRICVCRSCLICIIAGRRKCLVQNQLPISYVALGSGTWGHVSTSFYTWFPSNLYVTLFQEESCSTLHPNSA